MKLWILFTILLTWNIGLASEGLKTATAEIECGLSHHSYLDFLEYKGAIIVKTYGVADEDEYPADYYSTVSTSTLTIEKVKKAIRNKDYLKVSLFKIDPNTGEAIIGESPFLVDLNTFYPGGSYTSTNQGVDRFSRCGFDGQAYDFN